jgi:hypothetical protein
MTASGNVSALTVIRRVRPFINPSDILLESIRKHLK